MRNFRTIVITCVLAGFSVNNSWAQTAINYKNLAADFYEADGDVAVILLHGTLAHNRMEIITTISSLLSEDYDIPVLAPNLSLNNIDRMGDAIQKSSKGYARLTACDIEHTYTYIDGANEISQWVEYLAKEGFERIIVGGHSRGGRQASAYLAEYPRVTSVKGGVLIASGMSRNEQNYENYKKDTGVDLGPLLSKASTASPNQFIDVPKFIYCDNPRVTAAAFVSEYTNDASHSAPLNIAKVTDVTVLAIGGTEDTTVSDLEGDFADLADQPNLRIEMIDGADHFFRDLYADDVALLIAEMIEDL